MALLYHGDKDITAVRSKIFSYGEKNLTDQMLEAERIINRTLDSRWYRANAENNGVDWRETPFDPEKVATASQLKRAAVYKSLQLIYMYLAKESPEADGFERNSKNFQRLYADEINEVLNAGIDYDWDGSDDLSSEEKSLPRIRRLRRV